MSKKILLCVSVIFSVLFIISLYSIEIKICQPYDYSICSEYSNIFGEEILIFIPILILSLITYKMRDEIFGLWSKFTYIWLPLTLILVSIAPEYMNSWLPIYEKGFVSFIMSAIYLLASCVIIVVKYISLKKRVL
jgi:hypothetical protein